jgi:hypothetical protein
MKKTPLLALYVVLIVLPVGNLDARDAPSFTDSQIRQQIIQESVAAYLATGHPCACPYNSARNGSSCGGRSAYSRPGGAARLCYPPDVTDGMGVGLEAQTPRPMTITAPAGDREVTGAAPAQLLQSAVPVSWESRGSGGLYLCRPRLPLSVGIRAMCSM